MSEWLIWERISARCRNNWSRGTFNKETQIFWMWEIKRARLRTVNVMLIYVNKALIRERINALFCLWLSVGVLNGKEIRIFGTSELKDIQWYEEWVMYRKKALIL